MDIISVRRAVAKLKTQLFKNSNSYSIGMLKSHFKGSGLQFKEHQIYCVGDDVRFIDWRMVAKMNTPYVKVFEEERNVEIVVMIDAAATMFSGYNNISKFQASLEICSLLYLLSKETNDYVHAIILSDRIISLPKLSGEHGVTKLISVLQNENILNKDGKVNLLYRPKEDIDYKKRSEILMKYLNRRKEIVLLSDFNDFFDVNVLKKILYKSRVHCFQVISPLDEAEKLPYLIYCNDRKINSNGSIKSVDFYSKQELKGPLGKKFKRIKVHERYLEEFVKEML